MELIEDTSLEEVDGFDIISISSGNIDDISSKDKCEAFSSISEDRDSSFRTIFSLCSVLGNSSSKKTFGCSFWLIEDVDNAFEGLNVDSCELEETVPEGTEEKRGIAEEEIDDLEPLSLDFPREEPIEPSDTDGVLRDVRIEFCWLLEGSLVSLLSSDLKLSGAAAPFSKEFAEKLGGEDWGICAFARSLRTTRATKLVWKN